MKLIGGFGSTFVRRVAASLLFLELNWDHEAASVFDNPDAVRKYNPLVRVPNVVLDDGEALLESYAILDALDEIAGDAKRLIPASGIERRNVMRLTAVDSGTIDKAVSGCGIGAPSHRKTGQVSSRCDSRLFDARRHRPRCLRRQRHDADRR